MSVLERLKKLYMHNCLNCKHIDILPDEPESTRYDCFCPDFIWSGENRDPEFYWDPRRVNDCRHFEYKKLFEYKMR